MLMISNIGIRLSKDRLEKKEARTKLFCRISCLIKWKRILVQEVKSIKLLKDRQEII